MPNDNDRDRVKRDAARRRQAEQSLRMAENRAALARSSGPQDPARAPPGDLADTIHELQVHQIELEMQNDELRRAQEALEVSRARYFDLYDMAPVGYVALDKAGVIIEANLTAADLLGLGRSRLTDHRMTDFVYAQDQDTHYLHSRRLFETGQVQAWELRLLRQGGAPFWARFEATLGTDTNGAPTCRAVINDITQRRQADDALQEQRRVLDDIVEVTLAGYWDWDIAAGSQYLSPAFKRIFGYADAELPSTHESFRSVVHPDDLPAFLEAIQRHLAHQDPAPFQIEVRCRHKDGSTVWVLCTGRVLERASSGLPSRVVGCNLDITDQKRSEELTCSLRAQLDQAHRLEAIGTLAGGVAHDFNNILAGLLGGLELLDEQLVTTSVPRQDVRVMIDLVQRGAVLVRQLLGYARRGHYELRPFDLETVVRAAATLFGRTRTDLVIDLDCPPDLPAVLMDQAQLEQVLLNLFINAGQAMPQGGQLSLRAARAVLTPQEAVLLSGADEPYVRLDVSDTGSGMDGETRAHIFEPFFTTKEQGEGTGLGLASVYGILRSHSGNIQVTSEPGHGTTFSLYLPTTGRPAAEPRKYDPSVILEAHGTVLVVDDEELVRGVTGRMLRRIGYDTLLADGGQQAIELLGLHGARISLVLLDMTMPGMSGSQTFDALRALVPDLPIFICSGFSTDGQAEKLLARGGLGFIQKPFDIRTLATALGAVQD